MKIFVWGAGHCGRTLANALHHADHTIVGTWNRTAEAAAQVGALPWPTFWGDTGWESALDAAEVVWLAVPDRVIAEVSASVIRPHHIGLHAAGAIAASALGSRGLAAASVHPLQSFAEPMSAPAHVADITFGIQGDERAVAVGQQLVQDMGADSFVCDSEEAKVLYHAACCVASNALVALADQAVGLFEGAGVSRPDALRALMPLIEGTVANLRGQDEAMSVLTGPIARGDIEVVQQHERAIEARRGHAAANEYRALCRAIEGGLSAYRNRLPSVRKT